MPGMVAYTYNHSTYGAEAGSFPVQGQPELYSETLSQKTKG
jgi:hypothetical protein